LIRVPPNLIFEIDDAEDEWLYVSLITRGIFFPALYALFSLGSRLLIEHPLSS
jgi:hypothetical protein